MTEKRARLKPRDERRKMQCPFCGHETLTGCIGRVYCGPHKSESGDYFPAVVMREVRRPATRRKR